MAAYSTKGGEGLGQTDMPDYKIDTLLHHSRFGILRFYIILQIYSDKK